MITSSKLVDPGVTSTSFEFQILYEMASLDEFATLLANNNETLRKGINEDITKAKQEVLTSINSTLKTHSDAITALEQKVKNLEEKDQKRNDDDIQRELMNRRHNIILHKIEENEPSQEALFSAIMKLMSESIGEEIHSRDIDFLYRMGKKRNDGSRRPIIVRFLSLNLKQTVMKKWNFFKNKGIDIFDDFPLEIRERRRSLLPLAKSLKAKGLNASVRADKLYVNGEIWSMTRAQDVLQENEVTQQARTSQEEELGASSLIEMDQIAKKRDRSSPSSSSPSNANRLRKKPALKLQVPTSQPLMTECFTVPSPLIHSPRLNVPFVSSPQKNVQYTTIITDK